MMDVEKQSNGSDCCVLAIAYAFDLCSGLNPCTVRITVRSGHTWQRALKIVRLPVFLCWVRERVP